LSKPTRLLVISPKAGSMNDQVIAKLRKAFADYMIVEFDPKEDISKLVSSRARIVVAGGDGTVEFFVRKFADTNHPLGIISMGTYNNLARALGLPSNVDQAIKVARDGNSRAITLGRVNGNIFIEACAIGLFGETIALGDSAKEKEFGKLAPKLKDVISAKRFEYRIAGDFEGSGTAMSLVFSNTASIGSQLKISEGTPKDSYLEFTVHAGRSRTDIVARAIKAALPTEKPADRTDQIFRFQRLEVTTKPKVPVYADNNHVGRTPATITAELSALKVLLPR
jgi:diacylglycerol kinase family enzyme